VDYYRKGERAPLRQQTLLTAREQEIVRHLMTGASNTEIADSLFVSEHTVKSHLYNVFKKLNVKNRLQAVSWARSISAGRGRKERLSIHPVVSMPYWPALVPVSSAQQDGKIVIRGAAPTTSRTST
jgi:DNA-binding CsgD family transcriptional regulator